MVVTRQSHTPRSAPRVERTRGERPREFFCSSVLARVCARLGSLADGACAVTSPSLLPVCEVPPRLPRVLRRALSMRLTSVDHRSTSAAFGEA